MSERESERERERKREGGRKGDKHPQETQYVWENHAKASLLREDTQVQAQTDRKESVHTCTESVPERHSDSLVPWQLVDPSLHYIVGLTLHYIERIR